MQTAFAIKKIVLSKSKFPCTGRPVVPSFKVYDLTGRVIPPKYYTVVCYNNKTVGTATLHLTFSGLYSGTMEKTFRIVRGKQRISVKASSYNVKKAHLKKSGKTISLGASAKTKLSYRSSDKKHIKVSGGNVKIKKGTPRGTYTITVKAAKTKNFKGASRKIRIITIVLPEKREYPASVCWDGHTVALLPVPLPQLRVAARV